MDIDIKDDENASTQWTFSHSFPLPYRVLILICIGLWAWGSNLQILSWFGIDVHMLLSTSNQYTEKRPPTSYKSVYLLATILSAWVGFNLMTFWWLTDGDPAAIANWTAVPLFCYLMMITIVVCPFNILIRRERMRFLRCLNRVLFFKYGSEVLFVDGIMADILTSYAKVLGDLYVTGCILLFHNFEEAGIFSENRCWSYVIAPFFTSIPYIIRFRQCLSEYMKSSFHKKRHLFNTLKYASAFPVIFLSALQKRYDFATLDSDTVTFGQSTLYNLWLLSVAFNSIYSFYWDIEKDWELHFFTSGSSQKISSGRFSLKIPNFKLRQPMQFKWPIVYYLAMLTDFLLRFTWSLKLSSHLHVVTELEARVFLMECLEVGRRWLWIFFKMEKTWIQEQKTLGYELKANTRKPITTKESPSISSPNSTVFASFLEQDFDPKAWVNTALSSGRLKSTSSNTSSISKRRRSSTTTNTPTDLNHGEKLNRAQLSLLSSHTAVLVEKLEYLNQEISNRLERTVENVVKSMPNVISELNVLKEDTGKLKINLSTVQQHLGDVEGNTGIALDRLRYLDLVKTRMEASRAVLREAENWSSLEAEASTIFASQDYQKASVRLQEAEKSLAIFQNTPEYEERRKLLTELQNQLEATVSPQLIAALNQHDVKVCQKFYVIFDQIGRKKAFCNYYYGSRKAPLVQLWQGSLVLEGGASLEGIVNSNSNNNGDDDDNTKDTRFVDFLKKFYDECFVVLNEEYTWCGSVFPDANETLAALIENIFNSIKPPVTVRLAELVDYYHYQCLPQIIEAFTVSENFGRKIEHMLQKSIQTPKLSHTVEVKWGQSVFEPFSIYQHDYAAYEKNYLIAMLKKILSSNIKTSTVDLSRVILDTSGKLFNLVDDGLSRCMKFTHGFGSVGLIETLNQFFEISIKEYFMLLNKLRAECGLDLKESNRPSNNNNELFAKSFSGPASNLSLEDDFDQDNLAHEDWSNFQIGLRLLATCRTFSEKLDSFEHKTAETLLKINELIQSADIHNDKTNTKLHWYEQRRPSFQDVTTSIGTKASIGLLQESPLNSYQLRELISSLEENYAIIEEQEDEDEKLEIKNNQKAKKEQYLLFRPTIEILDQFIRGCQRFIFDTIFLPIVKHLSNISKMEVWKAAPESTKQRSVLNLEIPTFSLSPSEYITRIGEHLLTLPQQFEVYADDKSLAFSISSLPYNDDTEDFVDDDKIETMTITQKSTEQKSPLISNLESDTAQNTEQQENVKETITVTHAWITSIARGTMFALVEKILSIPQLSKHGTRQLLTDLGYLTNVLSALDISAVDELLQIYKMLEMEEEQVVKFISQINNNKEDFEFDLKNKEIMIKVAAIRGF
ncbi:7328_t:CDS:2 [Ambispora leptoticha]|uniref:Conserved oligomeric Golgi complex subunit 7 n=1 Tax=Ambispora leptoticha TaxID=144679 RepID=A0A9N9A433_9GLOM|nr:7328_t:CDS:2 [Ambispora leptoticha]